jgi:hypothetical protein
LKPTYGQISKIFENESSCKIIAINGDVNRDLIEKYAIKGYPTLKFFDAKNKAEPIDYTGAQDLESLTKFLNENCKTFRKSDGQLLPEAGVRSDVEDRIKELFKSNSPVNEVILTKEFGTEDKYEFFYAYLGAFSIMEKLYHWPNKVMGLNLLAES